MSNHNDEKLKEAIKEFVRSDPNYGYIKILEETPSLRDIFATSALQGLMPIYWDSLEEYENSSELIRCHVESAYEYADAMLKERAK